MDFSPRELRNALGLFPTGVAVVTGYTASRVPIGITVNSFTSVSLDPPLISFNAAKSLGCLEHLLRMETFVVNLLTETQSTVSTRFARANSDKWADAVCRYGQTENPILVPHLAMFECTRYAVHEAGDHLIIIGRVLHFEIEEQETPLVFFRGAYRRVGDVIEER